MDNEKFLFNRLISLCRQMIEVHQKRIKKLEENIYLEGLISEKCIEIEKDSIVHHECGIKCSQSFLLCEDIPESLTSAASEVTTKRNRVVDEHKKLVARSDDVKQFLDDSKIQCDKLYEEFVETMEKTGKFNMIDLSLD